MTAVKTTKKSIRLSRTYQKKLEKNFENLTPREAALLTIIYRNEDQRKGSDDYSNRVDKLFKAFNQRIPVRGGKNEDERRKANRIYEGFRFLLALLEIMHRVNDTALWRFAFVAAETLGSLETLLYKDNSRLIADDVRDRLSEFLQVISQDDAEYIRQHDDDAFELIDGSFMFEILTECLEGVYQGDDPIDYETFDGQAVEIMAEMEDKLQTFDAVELKDIYGPVLIDDDGTVPAWPIAKAIFREWSKTIPGFRVANIRGGWQFARNYADYDTGGFYAVGVKSGDGWKIASREELRTIGENFEAFFRITFGSSPYAGEADDLVAFLCWKEESLLQDKKANELNLQSMGRVSLADSVEHILRIVGEKAFLRPGSYKPGQPMKAAKRGKVRQFLRDKGFLDINNIPDASRPYGYLMVSGDIEKAEKLRQLHDANKSLQIFTPGDEQSLFIGGDAIERKELREATEALGFRIMTPLEGLLRTLEEVRTQVANLKEQNLRLSQKYFGIDSALYKNIEDRVKNVDILVEEAVALVAEWRVSLLAQHQEIDVEAMRLRKDVPFVEDDVAEMVAALPEVVISNRNISPTFETE